jgi:hypothetical protein
MILTYTITSGAARYEDEKQTAGTEYFSILSF